MGTVKSTDFWNEIFHIKNLIFPTNFEKLR